MSRFLEENGLAIAALLTPLVFAVVGFGLFALASLLG